MSTSGGGFAASGLLQGFAQAYTQARVRATQMEVEQRHGLASTLMQLYPNARPEAQADIAQRLLQIYSTPPGKKLDKKISDIGSLGAAAAQANAPGATPAGQQAAQTATNAQTASTQGQINAQPAPGAAAPAPPPSMPGIPPPPDLGPVAGGAGAPAGAVPLQGQTIPKPPAYSPFLSPTERNQQTAAAEESQIRAQIGTRRKIGEDMGLTGDELTRFSLGAPPLISRGQHIQIEDPAHPGQPTLATYDPLQQAYIGQNGQVIQNAKPWVASQQNMKPFWYEDPTDPTRQLMGFENAQGQTFDQLMHPLPGNVTRVQPGLVPKTTTTTETKPTEGGGYVQIPKTTTVTPNAGGGAGKTAPNATSLGIPAPPGTPPAKSRPSGGGGGAASGVTSTKIIKDKNGNPVYAPGASKPVIGIDADGRQVMVSRKDAEQMGLSGVMEAPAADVSKSQSARQWLPLASTHGDQPDQMGILQLIDKLDQKGALGPIASRWNDFVVGKLGTGTGDPETDALMEALRVKMGLSTTLLMNLHVGSRGGSYMMEHFEDLANAGKMDANILRSGVKSELNYAQDRAMMPKSGPMSKNQPPSSSGAFDVKDPNGKLHHFDNQEQADRFRALIAPKH